MSNTVYYVICALLAGGVLWGISMMSKVKTAVRGNGLSAACTLLAILITLYKYSLLSDIGLWICLAIGLVAGLIGAYKVKMIQMPQTVALLNGFGGAASALVAAVSVLDGNEMGAFSLTTAGLALAVGTVTLTGSLIAAGKLHKLLPQKPVILPGHQQITMAALVLSVLSLVLFPGKWIGVFPAVLLCVVISGFFGVVFAIRVGGADMPITISLLNSLSGVAGSIAGMAIGDPLLVAIGGIVGASGLLLTEIMCRAMNRKLMDILGGKTSMPVKKETSAAQKPRQTASVASNPQETTARESKPEEKAIGDSRPVNDQASPASGKAPDRPEGPAAILAAAKKVIIVPGYGMALAQAQSQVKQLSDYLEKQGCEVKFAIHPVAGRMPGHMNVLLCEVDVPYEQLYEMDAINEEFADCDAVLVVGANDVLNPAANTAEDTPIYGMPVLNVGDAKHIIFCNYDLKPGYAGVENPLYTRTEGVSLLLGDAAETVGQLLHDVMEASRLKQADVQNTDSNTQSTQNTQNANAAGNESEDPAAVLAAAKKVIIVPGYGMALAQAQRQVKQLCDYLEQNGAEVKFAIHPVAGRMPGHMNVLLCEVDVPYEQLYEMDAINEEFADCDAVLVVGANDVLNPAANTAEGTPIYGMPVLNVADAGHIIFCNYDLKPGYAGVENPLYTRKEGISLLLGDAAETVAELLNGVRMAVKKSQDPKAVCQEALEDNNQALSGQEDGKTVSEDPAAVLAAAKKVIIVPGYGMALAQAQRQVKQLADMLEKHGAEVKFAIHPVAGRMPGHMNVLLCEVDVPYEQLYEMDVINEEFADCDAVLVVGANDVLNPAANTAEGTPIYGMPVLNVADAAHIIFCNYDLKPGYAGVENPLYVRENGVSLLLGDAAETLAKLQNDLLALV